MSDRRSKTPRLAAKVLNWYDKNARVLPWRTGPAARKAGLSPDPYAVWLSEIMLQQTTVAVVAQRYGVFLERWPTLRDMAGAPVDDILGQWAGLGYYARARNLHKCAVIVAGDHGEKFPHTEQELLKLPGIGAYSAAAISAIAFDKPSIVVDGNITRIVSRLCAIEAAPPKSKQLIRQAAASIWPKKRSGDFAQGLMDFGALICTPRNPNCEACPLASECDGYDAGLQALLPKKIKKPAKPTRYGAAYVLFNRRGEVLLERRPDKGLLGGMLGLPGTTWSDEISAEPLAAAPERRVLGGVWRRVGEARHTFTHFHLILDVYQGRTGRAPKKGERWLAPDDARLPTAMKKALDLGLNYQGVEE